MLFNRVVRVEWGVPGTQGVRLEGLRTSFRVQHTADRTPSKAVIEIYNVSRQSLIALDSPDVQVRLYAGYGTLPRLLFLGTPVRAGVSLTTQGPDRILRVECGDGLRAFTNVAISASFTTGSNFGQVLDLVLSRTGWAVGAIDPAVRAASLPSGAVLFGRPTDILDRVVGTLPAPGAVWFVRDNALYVVRRGQATPEQAPLLSVAQGNLVGSPTATVEGVKARALIDATMRPGRAFTVESARVRGVFVCRDAVFSGDSGYAQPWYMDLTGRPRGAP